MKRLIAFTALGFCLALPNISQARDHHDRDDRGGYYDNRGGYEQHGRYDDRDRRDNHYDNRGHYSHHGDPVRFIGHVIALPFIVVGAVVGAAATVVAAPFNAHYYAQYDEQPSYGHVYPAQQQPYYAPPPPPPQAYYGEPQYSYAPPPQPYYRGY